MPETEGDIQHSMAFCHAQVQENDDLELVWTDEAGGAILPSDIDWMEGFDRTSARATAARHFDERELGRVKEYNRRVIICTIQHQLVDYCVYGLEFADQPIYMDHPRLRTPLYASARLQRELIGITTAIQASKIGRSQHA